ncbi:MAG TPA: hypothetical protein VLC95_17735, partial [Anaerolineae bacterium]|nr:hypothetical protein [Anaerolineae bacterium]
MSRALLATKLHRPLAPSRLVRRPHLTRRLHDGLATGRRLTLVSAPAGFGKTACVVEWLNDLSDQPAAWLSLDPADNDPARFVTYLVAAMQSVDPSLGRELGNMLRAGQVPPAEAIATTLINDILTRAGPCLLVLDDVHVIYEPLILDVLDTLVTNLPRHLHVVLLTREDPPLPLARLRANNQMTEVRASDLRFDADDARRFLNEVMGLSLSPADVTLLQAKTEGWIVGLQLAALAMQPSVATSRAGDAAAFIAMLSGSHRFILSYLTEEVLGRQPEEIQRFLLQTSILDRLCGDLCDAVTGRDDSHRLLEHLFRANLFLIPLDDDGQWYRYHHLFADLLCDRRNALLASEAADLHGRASRWYTAASGKVGTFATEAIEHALAAGDHALALELIELHAPDMIMRGYAGTVNGWVQAIPEEQRSSSLRTHLAFAWMHLLRGSYGEALTYLDLAREALANPADDLGLDQARPSLHAELLVTEALRLGMQDETSKSEAVAARALEIAPEDDSRVRSLAWFALANAHQTLAEYGAATEAYQEAIRHARAAGNLVAEWLSTSGLGLMAFERGKLQLAYELATAATQRGERSGSLPPISAVVYGLIGEVCYQWLDIEQARRPTERALELSAFGGYNTGAVLCRVILSRLCQIEGDLSGAVRWVEEAVDLMPAQVAAYVEQEVAAQQARAYLAAGRPASARLVVGTRGFSFEGHFTFPPLPAGGGISYSLGLLYNSSLHLLIHVAGSAGDAAGLRAGIELAGDLIERALASECPLVAIEAYLLR